MVVAKQSSYEDFRLKRVEENKKRMEALNLPKLSQNLNSVKTSPVLFLFSYLFTNQYKLVINYVFFKKKKICFFF